MSNESLSVEQKRRIAGRARTLQERLDAPADDGPAVENPEEWIDEWRDRVADGEPVAFERRLDSLGISEEEARAAVSTHGWPDDDPVPDWVEDLEEIVVAVTTTTRESLSDSRPRDAPFVDLLAPVVDYAQDQIDSSVAPTEVPAVSAALEPWLYERLQSLAAHSLFVEFKSYVAYHDRELALADDPDLPEDDRRYYREFVDTMLGDGFVRFVEEYALLSRFVVTTVRQWVSTVEEFSARLQADRPALRDWVGDGDLGAVETVEATGDRHNDGRVVFAVTFESGDQVAYKPRPLDAETAFYDLLDWLADHTDLPAIDHPAALTRNEYGWVEWVESEPCPDRAAVERYYRRAGTLLGILYALRFTDGHFENLIAVGEQPVVVDLETIAYPELSAGRLLGNDSPIITESVLRTGLLPVHDPDLDRADLSGFGSDERPPEEGYRQFTAVNTDLMEFETVKSDAETFGNLPQVDGESVAADEYFETLRGGFREAYDTLIRTREALIAKDGPLAALGDSEIRVIYRATRTYDTLLSSLTTPEYLQTGLKFGCKLEALARPQATETTDAPWSVHDHERKALHRLDVPRFTMSASETALRGPAEPVSEFAALSPRESAAEQLRALDATDRREQCRYVDLAFGEWSEYDTDHVDTATPRSIGEPDPVSDAEAEQVARDLFDRVSAAVVDDDGVPTWCVPSPRTDLGVQLRWTDENLYNGRLGVAVFAAGLAATTKRDAGVIGPDTTSRPTDAATLATEVADGVRDAVEDGDVADHLGVTGVGGLVYGFTVLDDLLDGDYLTDARQVAATVTNERIATADHCDVMDGVAGAILSLVALYERTGDSDILDRAVSCGHHLLNDRPEGRWEFGDDRALTGFSHGRAGIGYAFARLAGVTGDGRFREAVLDAVAFEDDHYDAETGKWADLRPHGKGKIDGWCNGRTGIGLARLGMLSTLSSDGIRRDVERALSGAPADHVASCDHACCGVASWIELFMRSGRQLDAPQYERRARRVARTVVPEDAADELALQSGTPIRPDVTLFQGLSGIGYTLLRVSNSSLPSVLLFE